jgi:hypothetical protein
MSQSTGIWIDEMARLATEWDVPFPRSGADVWHPAHSVYLNLIVDAESGDNDMIYVRADTAFRVHDVQHRPYITDDAGRRWLLDGSGDVA